MLTLRLIDVIFCLSETFLDKGILSDDVNLDIPGYNLVRADHSANTKGGGVCIYFRKSLPLRILDIHFLHECIKFEIRIGDKYSTLFLYIDQQTNLLKNLKHLQKSSSLT